MGTAMHCHDDHVTAIPRWTVEMDCRQCHRQPSGSATVPALVARSELPDSLESPGSDRQSSSGTALGPLELPELPASMDAVAHTPPSSDVTARIQARKLASITLDEIRQTQAADDSLQPVLQALKDQTKPSHNDLHQYPEDACVLLFQWDSLILQEGVLYQKFHYPDSSTNFLQIVLLAKL